MMRRKLCGLIRENVAPDAVFAEIGVADGKTSAMILRTFPKMRLLMVDYWQAHWSNRRTNSVWRDQSLLDKHYRLALERTDFAKDRRIVYRLDSIEAAAFVPDRLLGGFFLDSLHTPEAIAADLEAWGPKLDVGGLLVCHDIGGSLDRGFRGKLTKAVTKYAAENGFCEGEIIGQALWWTIKL